MRQEAALDDGANSDKDASEEETYILNTNNKKFHKPDCASVDQMNADNKAEYSGSREALIAQGYSPCGSCKP